MSSPADQPNIIELAPGAWVHENDLAFTFARSGGPGGQSVNKLNTKAILRVRPDAIEGLNDEAQARLRRLGKRWLSSDDELVIQAESERTQRSNRQACIDRLSEIVNRAMNPPKKRKPTKPSQAAKERRLAQKKELSEKKQRRRRSGDPRDG